VLIGGQVGIVGHIQLADEVSVGAQSGVSKSILDKGKVYRGSPARELREELRQEAAMRKLPEIIIAVRTLEEKTRRLEQLLTPEKTSTIE